MRFLRLLFKQQQELAREQKGIISRYLKAVQFVFFFPSLVCYSDNSTAWQVWTSHFTIVLGKRFVHVANSVAVSL